MDKLLCHIAAAMLTNAAMAQIAPLYQTQAGRSDNLGAAETQAWETHRVFYHSLVNAMKLEDPTNGWPAPTGGPKATAGWLAGVLTELGLPGGIVAQIAARLLAGVKPSP